MKIYCQLKGSKFCEGQGLLRKLVSDGQPIQPSNLYLVRDHNCIQDSNCVQVRYQNNDTNIKLGNVNKENAPLIAYCMNKGGTAKIISLNLYGSVDTNIGLYFMVDTTTHKTNRDT